MEKPFHTSPHSKFVRKIRRRCLVCGKWMWIRLTKSRRYDKGHFFSKLELPIKGTGEHVKIDSIKIGNTEHDVFKWTGKVKKIEYWECDACYDEPESNDPTPRVVS